jgi:hypothetical protein
MRCVWRMHRWQTMALEHDHPAPILLFSLHCLVVSDLGRTSRLRRHPHHRWGYDPRLSRTTECAPCWFNAPETGRAACAAERDLGAKATLRPRDLVGAGDLDFVYVTCSYPPGAQGTPTCNYGRDCGTLKSNGCDVGAILMEEGLVVPFICGATRYPKTPRP